MKTVFPDKAVLVQKKVTFEALRRLVMKTPVKTGRAQGNWQVTIGNPAEGQLDIVDPDGKNTISAGMAALVNLQPYQVVWISNNVDYIEALEHGHSQQAPQGMLSVTVEEMKGMFEREE